MPTYQDFVNSINNLLSLKIVNQTLQLNSNTREKAFEIYVLSLILEALRRAGGTFQIRGINTGYSPNPLVFRAAPGAIYSTLQDFAYIICSLKGKEFEMHVDIEFEGHSKATHEIDVSFIDSAHANRSRTARRNPKTALFICECKFYTKSTPSTNLARALVGLVSDLQSRIGTVLASNDGAENLKKYLSQKKRPDPFLDLSPLTPSSEQRFIYAIEHKLRKWANV